MPPGTAHGDPGRQFYLVPGRGIWYNQFTGYPLFTDLISFSIFLYRKGLCAVSEQAKEQPKVKLFREKSLEAVESPESLNDYLRVTSPGVWLVLAAVICLLVGAILWGVFGHIKTTTQVAVVVDGGKSVCYVPYAKADGILKQGAVTVEEKEYPLDTGAECELVVLSGDTSIRLLKAGELSAGDPVVLVPAETDLADGIYDGVAVTEDLHPISLLLQ